MTIPLLRLVLPFGFVLRPARLELTEIAREPLREDALQEFNRRCLPCLRDEVVPLAEILNGIVELIATRDGIKVESAVSRSDRLPEKLALRSLLAQNRAENRAIPIHRRRFEGRNEQALAIELHGSGAFAKRL